MTDQILQSLEGQSIQNEVINLFSCLNYLSQELEHGGRVDPSFENEL